MRVAFASLIAGLNIACGPETYGLAALASADVVVNSRDPFLNWSEGQLEETPASDDIRNVRLAFPAPVAQVPAGERCPELQATVATLNGAPLDLDSGFGINTAPAFTFRDDADDCVGPVATSEHDPDALRGRPLEPGSYAFDDDETRVEITVDGLIGLHEVSPPAVLTRGERIRITVDPPEAASRVLSVSGGVETPEFEHEGIGSRDFETGETVYGEIEIVDGAIEVLVLDELPVGTAILGLYVSFALGVTRCDGVPACTARVERSRNLLVEVR